MSVPKPPPARPRPKRPAPVEKFSEGYRLPGVEIFSAGVHRGREYAASDLDDIVANFDRASRPQNGKPVAMHVPLVVGHEEGQEYLKRSDLPAAGWITRVYRQGDKLLADIDHVPAQFAKLIAGLTYRTVSAEIYDAPPAGVGGSGKMLRRVAALGGDIPEVKGLAEIPTPESYSEAAGPRSLAPPPPARFRCRGVAKTREGAFAVFSEVTRLAEPRRAQPGMRVHLDGDPQQPHFRGGVARRDDSVEGTIDDDGAQVRTDSGSDVWVGDRNLKDESGAPFGQRDHAEGPMQREQMLQQLADAGMDTSALTEAVPDEALAEICRLVCGGDQQQPPQTPPIDDQAAPPDMPDMPDMAGPGGMPGKPPGMPGRMPFDEARSVASLTQKQAAQTGRDAGRPISRYGEAEQQLQGLHKKIDDEEERKGNARMFSEENKAELAALVGAAVEKALAERVGGAAEQIKGSLDALKKFSEEDLASAQKRTVDGIIERLELAGKLPPVQREMVRQRLLATDATRKVFKYTEGGKTQTLTAFEAAVKELELTPGIFGERIASGGDAPDEELAKVEKFSESPQMQGALRATGKKPADFVEGFKKLQKERPRITATEYGVPEIVA